MGITNWFKKKVPAKPPAEPSKKISPLELKQLLVRLTGKTSQITVLEAGASGGEDTVGFASLPEIGKIYAFEPVQKSFAALNKKAEGKDKIQTFKLALSDEPGEIFINLSTNTNRPDGLPSSSSILQPTGHLDFHSHITFAEKEKVHLTTVDRWAAENAISTIDIMWLDMQGAEHMALKGAKKVLRDTKVIYSEVSLKPMYANSLLYPQYKEFLSSIGFIVHSEYLFWEDMGNVLFVRK